MKRWHKIVLGLSTSLALGVAAVAAYSHPGMTGAPGPMRNMGPGHATEPGPMGMMHGMGPGMAGPMSVGKQQADPAFAGDMSLVHEMVHKHDAIERSVTNLPDGIRTVTESQDPQVAQVLKAHVASMERRLNEGRVFNLFSPTLPVLFANKDKIKTVVEATEKGSIVTQTSADPAVVDALQKHALEVSELARDGRLAMMRGMRAAMGR